MKSLCKICLTVGWKHSFCLSFTPSLFLPASSFDTLLFRLCSLLSCHSSHRTKCMLDNALSLPLCISPFVLSFQSPVLLYLGLHWLKAAMFQRGQRGFHNTWLSVDRSHCCTLWFKAHFFEEVNFKTEMKNIFTAWDPVHLMTWSSIFQFLSCILWTNQKYVLRPKLVLLLSDVQELVILSRALW